MTICPRQATDRLSGQRAAKAWKEAAGVDNPEALKTRFDELQTDFDADDEGDALLGESERFQQQANQQYE